MATETAQNPAAKRAADPKPITAPPSTAYKIVDVPEIHRDVIQRHAVPVPAHSCEGPASWFGQSVVRPARASAISWHGPL